MPATRARYLLIAMRLGIASFWLSGSVDAQRLIPVHRAIPCMSRTRRGGAPSGALVLGGARTDTIPRREYFRLALCPAKTGASG